MKPDKKDKNNKATEEALPSLLKPLKFIAISFFTIAAGFLFAKYNPFPIRMKHLVYLFIPYIIFWTVVYISFLYGFFTLLKALFIRIKKTEGKHKVFCALLFGTSISLVIMNGTAINYAISYVIAYLIFRNYKNASIRVIKVISVFVISFILTAIPYYSDIDGLLHKKNNDKNVIYRPVYTSIEKPIFTKIDGELFDDRVVFNRFLFNSITVNDFYRKQSLKPSFPLKLPFDESNSNNTSKIEIKADESYVHIKTFDDKGLASEFYRYMPARSNNILIHILKTNLINQTILEHIICNKYNLCNESKKDFRDFINKAIKLKENILEGKIVKSEFFVHKLTSPVKHRALDEKPKKFTYRDGFHYDKALWRVAKIENEGSTETIYSHGSVGLMVTQYDKERQIITKQQNLKLNGLLGYLLFDYSNIKKFNNGYCLSIDKKTYNNYLFSTHNVCFGTVTDEELKTYNNIKIDDVYDEKTDGIGAPPYIYCINNDDNVKKEAKTYSNMDNSYVKNRGKLWGAIDNCKKNYRKTKDKAK